MPPYLIMATINRLSNLKVNELIKNDVKLIVVDEGDEQIRRENENLLKDIDKKFYGPRERLDWFKARFGSSYERYSSVIPERAHAETSFGFLIAYEEDADFIIELDDDVYINDGFIEAHRANLFNDDGETVYSKHKWYNTIDLLIIDKRLFPRGHPYAPETRLEEYSWINKGGKTVLNMGHWIGDPDLDALTILYYGGFNGKCDIKGRGIRKEKVIIGEGTYFALCSMNTSFLTKIVPAFYQLYMNFMGIDRFDDIWSGIFLKRIADHLGDKLSIGKPIGFHDKRPRSVFKDLKKELDGMIINEWIWRAVDEGISGNNYSDAYLSLADLLELKLKELDDHLKKFMEIQITKMRLWIEIIDKIS
ncbi:MAG: hypothetical protein NZ922_00840 [Candidatus Methanomethyliaceae archaeon]|nr:hypothetical protein [Candidatus Methanomethyliaceae archaeon]MDW7970275.1 hypothetical protein [Nitrososphaerota archaeon]